METYIDIVVPIYNTPIEDIERCLNSVLAQNYRFWKLYLINDGSELEVKKYLDCISNQDERIFVYHIENGGVSNARNYGLGISSSPYFCFIDADDEFERYFLGEALSIAQRDNSDIVIGGIKTCDSNGIIETFLSKETKILSTEEQITQLIDYLLSTVPENNNQYLNKIMVGRPYPKLYKRILFSDICFDTSLKVHEDNIYSYDIFQRAKNVSISKKSYYIYWQTNYSTTHKKANKETINIEIRFLSSLLQRASALDESSKLMSAFTVRFSIVIGTILRNCCFLRYSQKEIRKILDGIFKNGEFQRVLRLSIAKKYIDLRKRISVLYYIVYNIIMLKYRTISIALLLNICRLYKCLAKITK